MDFKERLTRAAQAQKPIGTSISDDEKARIAERSRQEELKQMAEGFLEESGVNACLRDLEETLYPRKDRSNRTSELLFYYRGTVVKGDHAEAHVTFGFERAYGVSMKQIAINCSSNGDIQIEGSELTAELSLPLWRADSSFVQEAIIEAYIAPKVVDLRRSPQPSEPRTDSPGPGAGSY